MLISAEYQNSYKAVFQQQMEKFPEQAYESSVPSYTHGNKLMSWLFWRRIDAALRLAGDIGGQKVLDIGCGTGVLFRYLHEHHCTIVGCDPVSRTLAEYTCEKMQIHAHLYDHLADISGAFETIFALDVFEHVEDLKGLIQKTALFSRNGTKVIVSGPTENFLYGIGRRFAGFSGEYHLRNIYEIEEMMQEHFSKLDIIRLFFPFVFFRISSWALPVRAH